MAEERRLADVFGISRDVPLNYEVRQEVDGVFVDSLTRDKHLVIHGGSKQGKTCLRKFNLKDDDYIVVTCSNRWDLGQLNSAILKTAGFTISQSTTKTVSGNQKIAAKFTGKIGVPGVAEIAAGYDAGKGKDESLAETRVALELDPMDVNDVIEGLRQVRFKKFIVLEDFHYLPDETQRDFAVALKAFHESSDLCFVVVGVWLDENRLIQYNGDLSGRVMMVNVDKWSADELRQVVTKGERLLNVRFDEEFVGGIVSGCFDSVYVLQEACYKACEMASVFTTRRNTVTVGKGVDPAQVLREVVGGESGRYNDFISKFAGGFKETELEMYRWLLLPVLDADAKELEAGLTYNHITHALQANHDVGKNLNLGNVTQSLQSTASLQVKLGIKPIVLDYDQSRRRLNVVDRGFLIWLNYQDRGDLLESAGLPRKPAKAQ